MKRFAFVLAVMFLSTLFGGRLAACPWGGHGAGWSTMGSWEDPGGGPGVVPLGQSQRFLDETADLRKALASKEAEYEALMAGSNPDPGRAGRLSREILDLREQLRVKARGFYGRRHGGGHHGWGRGPDGWRCGGYCW